jgi:hypothetical protein
MAHVVVRGPALGEPVTAVPPDHSGFSELWTTALNRYQEATGRPIALTDSLLEFESVDDVGRILEERATAFKAFRKEGEKLRAVLAPFVRFVRLFVESGAEVAAASVRICLIARSCFISNPLQSAVPGGKAIFVAFAVLLEVRYLTCVWSALLTPSPAGRKRRQPNLRRDGNHLLEA